MDKQKQIEEMPICVNCIHAYVCEEYNLNRDMLIKKCAYHNDHFLDIEQHNKQVRKETAEEFAVKLGDYFVEHCGGKLSISLTLQKWYKMIDEIAKEITEGKK